MLLTVQDQLKELSLLFIRLFLSYRFYEPAKTKLQVIKIRCRLVW